MNFDQSPDLSYTVALVCSDLLIKSVGGLSVKTRYKLSKNSKKL